MSEEFSNKLPSFKDSTKFFTFQGLYAPNAPFKVFPAPKLLTTNGLKIVRDFYESAGEFLGGGVMKSEQLELYAEKDERCRAVKARVMAQSQFLSHKENMRLSTQITSEWIALEYALILSVTLYGLIRPIKWDKLESVTVRKKGFIGIESIATLTYVDAFGVKQVVDIQSGKPNIDSLAAIAKAVGI
jgi:hypothetical protein